MGLIPSHRHTARDLEHWRAVSACDAEIGVLAERKAAKAIEHIQRFVERCPDAYAGVSWGKDSVVVAHLVHRANVGIPIWWCIAGEIEMPESMDVRDRYLSITGQRYEETWCDPSVIRWSVDGHDGAQEAFARDSGRYISGVRAQESGARKMRMRHHGVSSLNTCAPIGYWSDLDVYGYLALHDLPIHPAYAMSMGGSYERGRLRVATVGGVGGQLFGRAEWEHVYYPDIVEHVAYLREHRAGIGRAEWERRFRPSEKK